MKLIYLFSAGWSWTAQSVRQHAAEDPRQQVQLRQLPLLGQLRNAPHPPIPPLPQKAVCVYVCAIVRACLKLKTKKANRRHTTLTMSNLGPLCPAPPHLHKSS